MRKQCTCLSNAEPKHHASDCPLFIAYRTRRESENKQRRARHQAMLDLGLKRVKGALGGVYYE